MAGEWIKVESITPDKPEVVRLARLLNIDRDLVLGKLVRLWAWFDRNSVDGIVDGVVSTDVDDIVRLPGFMAALRVVGWGDFDDTKERVWLPKFEEHNGETAKKRAQKNRRQARWRAGSPDESNEKDQSQNVDAGASTRASTREEKSRGKKNIPSSGDSKTEDAIRQVPMHAAWEPSVRMQQQLLGAGLPTFMLNEILPGFRLYWIDRREVRSAREWNATFRAWANTKANDAGIKLNLPLRKQREPVVA